jgi:hypothetical protein
VCYPVISNYICLGKDRIYRKTRQDGESNQVEPLEGSLEPCSCKEKLEWLCICGTQDCLDIKLQRIEMSHLFQNVMCHRELISMLLKSITVPDEKWNHRTG